MIPSHFSYQIHPSFFQQNYCTPPKCVALSEYTDSAHIEVESICSRYTNGSDAGAAQDYFVLPALPVGGLPISQDGLDRMKLVRDRTIPIILPSGKNILVNMVFKVSVVYTNLDTRQIQSSRVCIFIAPNANMGGYPTKGNVFIGKIKKDTLLYHHPDQGMFQLNVL